jgi:hypothetical protein
VFRDEIRIGERFPLSYRKAFQYFEHVGVLVMGEAAFVFFDCHRFKISTFQKGARKMGLG